MTDESQRREPRHQLETEIEVAWGSASPRPLRALDISKRGMFLECDPPPAFGTDVRIGTGAATLRARAVFIMDASLAQQMGRRAGFGVEFTTPIDPDAWLLELARSRAMAAGSSSTAPTAAPDARSQTGEFTGSPAVVVMGAEANQKLVASALRMDGFTPLVARHGFEALAFALERRPVVIVAEAAALDTMPDVFLQLVRNRRPLATTRVVFTGIPASAVGNAQNVTAWMDLPGDLLTLRRGLDAALQGVRGELVAATATLDARAIASQLFLDVERLFERGNESDAMKLLEYLCTIAPTVPTYHGRRWAMTLRRNPNADVEAARKHIDELWKLHPNHVELLVARGRLALLSNDRTSAWRDLSAAIQAQPQHPEATLTMHALKNLPRNTESGANAAAPGPATSEAKTADSKPPEGANKDLWSQLRKVMTTEIGGSKKQ